MGIYAEKHKIWNFYFAFLYIAGVGIIKAVLLPLLFILFVKIP